MRKYITANIQNLGQDETLAMISRDTLDRIKRTDKRPEIKVFAIAHEGTAHGTELSFGAKVKKAFEYVKDMIVRIGEKLQIGTPIFNRHGETNAHTNREQIGELVGKAVRYVGNKLAALAAVYIYPEHRKLPLDVASFEADIEYLPKTKDKAEVIDINNISGIALSNSAIDEPAFKGATLMAAVTYFIESGIDKKDDLLNKVKDLRKRIKENK